MIKVLYGKKGMGKTKVLIDTANQMATESNGDVVFIDGDSSLMYDLKHEIRFINATEFPVSNDLSFLGFICGIISEDYDIDSIFIDGLSYLVKQSIQSMEGFFKTLETVAEKYNIQFTISMNGDEGAIPEYLKKYLEMAVV